MTRKVHGAAAGPWLGSNTVVFSISGALVPLIALVTSRLLAQCAILAAVTGIGTIMLYLAPSPGNLPDPAAAFEPKQRPVLKTETPEKSSFPYVIEVLAAWEALWLIGGKVAATSYFTTYVDETQAISPGLAGLLIVALWVGISAGRLVGIVDQMFELTTDRLYRHMYIQLWFGALGMAAILAFPNSSTALWFGVVAYGFFNGPTIGYVYDLCNRTTAASEKGMSIVMFGLNLGASLVPFAVSWTWENGGGPLVLPEFIMASHLLPIPCQFLIRKFTKDPAVVTWRVAKQALFEGTSPPCSEKPGKLDTERTSLLSGVESASLSHGPAAYNAA
mmetsp:Transcript_56757/g.128651  ORF Transcript_56757/g.128651 Transcript_56757/m.128651 type:complete len:333 (-) Transcript_56757:57-1055(-)|eukprot:CAMPEP_0172593176 /NCGR_PEP_ID=MMETSP1068-20121228/12343_1 /TAXON_ID=35684 /ORGANISM="Pseudopedinella elastica, Strain CCMP716" /LENGTH=332 /DNA_ID=CAMNT_0013390573 /DNA_START=752 /DNA_END=1750 /DNA_ORIENTATION=-